MKSSKRLRPYTSASAKRIFLMGVELGLLWHEKGFNREHALQQANEIWDTELASEPARKEKDNASATI